MGIRALELAKALAGELDVRLIVPNDPAEAREVAASMAVVRAGARRTRRGRSRRAGGRRLRPRGERLVPRGSRTCPWRPTSTTRFRSRTLHYARLLGPETALHDHRTLALALARADFFLCASAEQRLFYAGALYASGRIGSENFPDDPALTRLLAVVPFGVPSSPARGDRAAGRARRGSAGGGTAGSLRRHLRLVRPGAAARGLARDPGGATPTRGCSSSRTRIRKPRRRKSSTRAREHARRIDPAGDSILFSPWLPYASRADLYAAADLLVSITSHGLETELAYRTRLLDAAWGGVPSVTVGGGSLARELVAAGAAFESGRAGRGSWREAVGRAALRLGAAGPRGRRGSSISPPRGTGNAWPRRWPPGAGRPASTRTGFPCRRRRRALSCGGSSSNLPLVIAPEASDRGRPPSRPRAPPRGARGPGGRAAREGLNAEILLVDNASETPQDAVLRRHPTVRRIASARNVGFAEGCRLGVAAARAPIAVFVNDDAAVAPDAPRRLVAALAAADPDVVAVGGRLTDRTGAVNDFWDGFLTFDGHAFAADVGQAGRGPAGRGSRGRSGCSPAAGSWRCAAPTSWTPASTPTTSRTWRTSTSAGGSGSSAGASSPSRARWRATAAERPPRRSASSRAAFSSRRTRSRRSTRTWTTSASVSSCRPSS